MSYKIVDIDPVIFRGYDIRGVAGKELSADVLYTLGRGLATWYLRRRITQAQIGHDCRNSSEEYSAALIAGLNDGGVDTIDLGLSMTQIKSFSAFEFKNKGAVLISASHNPKEYNGLKIGKGYAEEVSGEDLQDMRKIIANRDFIEPKQIGKNKEFDIFPAYNEDINKRFNLSKKWKVVVEGCNNGSGIFYPQIFRKAGCEVIEQNCEPDGDFPLGTPDPTETKVLERLAEGVKKAGADIGFAFDTDGDRMSVVDEKGNPVYMDMIVALFAKDILRNQPGAKIVYNALCSRAVTESVEADGGVPVVWITGHTFIHEKMVEEGALFGGELSGHIFFNDDFYGYDDGANACLRLLNYLEYTGQTVHEAVDELPKYVSSPNIKLELADDIKFKFIDNQVADAFRKTWPDAKFLTIDGIHMDMPDRSAIVRASQNGPYVSIKFEGKTQEVYEDTRKKLLDIIQSFPEIGWDDNSNAEALLK